MNKVNALLGPAVATLITLCAAPAAAQSNVTLYALVDLNINNVRGGSRSGVGNITALTDGTANGLNGSRWGIRAQEDLGSGLKAGVVLESGLNADTGTAAQGGRAFGRQAFVSLSSTQAGEIRLGRQYALHDIVLSFNNPFVNGLLLNPGYGITNVGKPLPQQIDAPRIDNVVQYQTPVFAGFTARVQVAPGEGTNDRLLATGVAYSANALGVSASYEENKDRFNGNRTNKVATLGLSYDFGPVRLQGGYQTGRLLTTNPGNVGALSNLVVTGSIVFTARDLNVYTLALSAPFGTATVGGNYTHTQFKSASGQTLDVGRAAFGIRYGLSKNTFLYSALSVATADLKDYISQKRQLQAGLRTAF